MEEIDPSHFVYPPDQALHNAISDLKYAHEHSLYFNPVVSVLIKQALGVANLAWEKHCDRKD